MGRETVRAGGVAVSVTGQGGGPRPPPVSRERKDGAAHLASLVETPVGELPLEAPVWFVEREARPMGPYRVEQLRTLWQQHRLEADPLLWCESWPNWRRLSRVPALVGVMTRSGAPAEPVDERPFLAPVCSPPAVEKKPVALLGAVFAEQEAQWQRMWQEEQARLRARVAGGEARRVEAPEPEPRAAVGVPERRAPVPSMRDTLLLIGAILGPLVLGYVATSFLRHSQGAGTELLARPPGTVSPEAQPTDTSPGGMGVKSREPLAGMST